MTTTTDLRPRISAVIRALLAKTTQAGATEAEALSAAAKARELMDRYQLDLGQIGMEAEGTIKAESPDIRFGRMILSDYLAVNVARYCDCKVWGSGNKTIFFGLRSDTDFATWLVASLTDYVSSAARTYLIAHPTPDARTRWQRQKAFAMGATASINNRLKAATIERNRAAHVTSTGTSLMVIKNQIVEREFARLGLNLRATHRTTRTVGGDAFSAGTHAGNSASFGRPLTTNGGTLRLASR